MNQVGDIAAHVRGDLRHRWAGDSIDLYVGGRLRQPRSPGKLEASPSSKPSLPPAYLSLAGRSEAGV